MRLKVWGSRGSLAAPGPETLRFGGNTSCVELRLADGSLLILDAGTGIRPLGVSLGSDWPRTIHLLLTHLHLDHLIGLGFFGPLWSPDVDLHIWGPASPTTHMEERITRYLSPPLFPVHLKNIPSHPTFHDAPDEEWEIGGARLMARAVTHQGPTVGYRIEENGRVLAYIPDHEPGLGIDLETVEPEWISGYEVARGADVLFHDAQYTSDEYGQRIGWGHSRVEDTVMFALIAKVQRLVMFHHDPLHTDADLHALLARAREVWGEEGRDLSVAYEGMEIDLS